MTIYYRVAFGSAFDTAPVVMVTPVETPAYTDGNVYPASAINVVSRTTAGFDVYFGFNNAINTASYIQSFCFTALQ
ncbi:hypothetical protein [Kineobactrum salinum]|uniref:Uncharacterized protein n=1 Tax=Kineobactrum salinum TaxID=2708301 RepID=A0A6C0U5M6_9GAMM|nr:hypothetical protein [Kineobactrum salinum]QIB65705.1 hypothetical protein G3T16_10045 [Kineobactrum salinum]